MDEDQVDNRHPADIEAEARYKLLDASGSWAFPRGGPLGIPTAPGMLLRDYFAARALPAIYAAAVESGHTDQESIAAEAYELADAMLAARKADHDGKAVRS